MGRSITSLPLLALVALLQSSSAQNTDAAGVFNPLQYVDQLIGAAYCGNVFAGSSLPHGMAKAAPDVNAGCNQGGFATDPGNNVTGFSQMHDSGTGGSPSLGNFALFPYTSCAGGDVDGCVYPKTQRNVPWNHGSLLTSPGYFGLTLENGIAVDMTSTQHTNLFRFNFPAGSSSDYPLILMDLTDLSDSRQNNASITVDPVTGRMTGDGRFLPSFGIGSYVAYFCADFSGAAIHDNGIFVNSRANTSVKSLNINRGINGYPLPGGAFNRFANPGSNPILARVGVSYISSDQACSNAENEIPDFNFQTVRQAAHAAWESKLSPIVVDTTGVSNSLLTNFYSGIYRTFINPQNYTGENSLWQSTEPYWDSFYCIWDLFRATFPFMLVVDPVAMTEMTRSMIDTYRNLGWLPDCRMSLNKGYTQGGSNADNVLADLYVKGFTEGINWNDGYAALVQDAEVEPPDWYDEGRGGLDSWHDRGYIPVQDWDYKGQGTMTRSVSRTLEYAYNDFCVAQVAQGLGRTADVTKYQQRSGNWRNLYESNQTSSLYKHHVDTGFTGFFQPKFLNGTFGYQNPLMCSNIDHSNDICSLQRNGAETFESSIWEYSFFVPHDQSSLIKTFGGAQQFVARLDYLHDTKITYIGNEPAFLTVFQYHYAGRPGKSAARSHFYIPKYFSTTHAGLPGNDDSGSMGAFVAFSMMGLFPNPGQNVYLITPPFFASVNITSPLTGKTATIRNVNFDPTYQAIYIQSATLNGKPYTKNWIDHSFFTQGQTLELVLGKNESSWGTHAADLPPSLGLGAA